ncbi:Flp pilus assembly complex ATPase component TadA [Candidatus Contubernalis alkalaceticus]|nr:ATPase, T2SS/T4P/T4SS family [Candidatus Contubernalis alkalaceticus]UNC92242.1 Flp pilus assembly complex ATPase component TadA [Candidatus Contubernalis alkalaceticus]
MFSKSTYKLNEVKSTQSQLEKQKTVNTHKKKEMDQIANQTLRQVIDTLDEHIQMDNINEFQKKQFDEKVLESLNEILMENRIPLSQGEKQKVIEYVTNEMFGFGPINNLISDPNVTEIMVNGSDKIYVEKGGKLHKTDVSFRDDDHVLHIINKIINPLGRRIDESSPAVDARLPDGSRVNAVISPLSITGPSLTIRKFSTDPFQTEDLINFNSITKDMIDFLEACVRTRLNIIVSGGTGSGKTTTLNVLSSFIPEGERIVTIEDTAELQLRQEHVITLESRSANIEGKGEYSIRELVRNCLRMRPDRIVVGEVRGGETLDMLQAMNTGHDGSISTLHANSPRDAIVRLETMVLMAGMELPLCAIREQIASSVNIIVQQARMSDGTRKITKITELIGMEDDNIKTQDIFVYEQKGTDPEGMVQGKHKPTGIVPQCMEKILLRGEDFSIERIPEWKQQNNVIESEPDYQAFHEPEKNSSGESGKVVRPDIFALEELEVPLTSTGSTCFSQVNETQPTGFYRDRERNLCSLIPENMRGINISVSGLEPIANFISYGSKVDILVVYADERDNRGLSASTIVENALVLSDPWKTETLEGSPGKPEVIFIAATPEQAEKLVYASVKGTFYITVRTH